MSLSKEIFLALGLGILTGIFFGEMVAFLQVPADIYILLLQMTVLPYVILSLVLGFGSLSYQNAKLLAVKGLGVLLLLWMLAFAVLLLMPLAFPDWKLASFFSPRMTETPEDINYYEIFIPYNLFYSLSRNLVPAVVIFSISFGVALIGIKEKQQLLSIIAILKETLTRITDFIVSLMPLGVFVIAASAAGTMYIEEFGKLQVYLVLYIAVSLLFTFWILPGLVAALTPIRFGDIIRLTRDAMVSAFMTATLLVVLPLLVENSKTLLKKYNIANQQSDSVLDAVIPASFNFPQTGKVLAMSFILFAGWFTNSPMSLSDYPGFIFFGLASFFGSLNVAIPFLLDFAKVPADMFQLFVISSVLNSRFGTLLAAMHTLVLGLLVTCAITGGISINPKKILRYVIISCTLTLATIGSAGLLFNYGLSEPNNQGEIIAGMHIRSEKVKTIVHKNPPSYISSPELDKSKYSSIIERGYIKVGYLANNLPYSYFNAAGDLVGFDVEMAHIYAKEFNLTLEFVPVTRDNMQELLDAGYCDIIMSGIAVTASRGAEMNFSVPYVHETLAFVVKDYRRHEFESSQARTMLKRPKIADFSHHANYANAVRRYIPQAEFVRIESIDEFFSRAGDDIDAILLTAERGAALSMIHPEYTVVLPRPKLVSIPIAYPLSFRFLRAVRSLNNWLELKQLDGTIDTLYNYWLLGKNAVPQQPRWSVIKNVLHWVD